MAAVTHGVQTGSTLNVTSYATAAFTPAANDLLVCMVEATDTVAAGSVTSTGNTASWTRIDTGLFGASLNKIYLFVQTALCTATSTVVTFDCTGDAATGAIIAVARVSGMTKTGAAAVRQTAKIENQSQPTIGQPLSSPTMASAVLTGNPTLEFIGHTTTDSFNPPTNWTEGVADTTASSPAQGFEYHFRNSGFTGTSTGWADTTGQASVLYAVMFVELDTSSGGTANNLTVDPGSYAITGAAATLNLGLVLSATPGSYLISGTAASLPLGHALSASPGAYTLAGTDMTPQIALILSAIAGAYAVSGADTTLTVVVAGVAYNLTVDAGTYTVSGASITTPVARVVSASPGSYIVVGDLVDPPVGRVLVVNPGDYTVTGATIQAAVNRLLNANPGVYVISGNAATLQGPAPVVSSTRPRLITFKRYGFY